MLSLIILCSFAIPDKSLRNELLRGISAEGEEKGLLIILLRSDDEVEINNAETVCMNE
jgi:hypothetical protein